MTDLRSGLETEQTSQHAFAAVPADVLWKGTERVGLVFAGDAAGVPLLPPTISEADFDVAVRVPLAGRLLSSRLLSSSSPMLLLARLVHSKARPRV